MVTRRVEQPGRKLLGIALGLALAGCNLLGGSGEPDRLAKWVLPNAVLLGEAAANPESGQQIQQSPDGRGYLFVPPPSSSEAPSRLYLVPLGTIDAGIDAAVRKAVFPGGIATYRDNRAPSEAEGNDTSVKLAKLAETEFEAFYLAFTIVDQSALCDGLTKACDGVGRIMLLGKLKGLSVVGADSEVLMLDAVADAAQTVFGKSLEAAPTRCGFDPERDALPVHIAGACRTMLKLEWAKENDFTLDQFGGALPLSPEALKVLLAELPKVNFYEKGELQGRLEKVQ